MAAMNCCDTLFAPTGTNGLPGVMCAMPNVTSAIANSVGMNQRVRRNAYINIGRLALDSFGYTGPDRTVSQVTGRNPMYILVAYERADFTTRPTLCQSSRRPCAIL